MLSNRNTLAKSVLIILLACAVNSLAADGKKKSKGDLPKLGSAPAVLWREPVDIKTRDLFYGQGGPDHMPNGKLTFIEEKFNGVNPKFDVRDESGIRWGVKMGNEAKPETAATRLIWAVGYFTNEDYYLPELKVGDLALTRGQNRIKNSKIDGVRLKRHNKGEHQVADWSWDKNPFVGTKELDGLKIMMEIICNTDLKTVQQHVYDVKGVEQRYVAADVGGSFGKAGKGFMRTKGKLSDYQALPLIKNAGPEYIDFWHFKHIPRANAIWIGGYLTQLSDQQLRDAFRAGGFSDAEIDGFSRKVRDKINELVSLQSPSARLD
ncbi:MAG: hypothetical protein LAO76_12250 [Acidobacteriia bacterium]|nr:hypothetical protein [Terriglobia bacterium]